MAVLGTYLNAGACSLADGTNCIAHGLGTTPDFATWTPTGAAGAAALVSIPAVLVTRTGSFVLWENRNGGTKNGEMLAGYAHTTIR